jgi:hypothetical protein
MGAHEALEHAEHAAHGSEHGGKLGMWIGITMATLGVLLAFAAAKVGGERTELVQELVAQQHAHAKYQAQDIKHRVAANSLRQVHAAIPTGTAATALDGELKKIEQDLLAKAAPGDAAARSSVDAVRAVTQSMLRQLAPNKEDAALLATAVERYRHESQVAKDWVESFDPIIAAHAHAQERYEIAQLFAEIGIVVASIALMMKRRTVWLVAIALGVVSVGFIGTTYAATGSAVHAAEAKVHEKSAAYRDLRSRGSLEESDQALIDDIRAWTGTRAAPAPAPANSGAPPKSH